jgi:hypothetical protein
MNRLLVRRCSMSSIEEEDEPSTSDELTIRAEKLPSSKLQYHHHQLHHSSSIPDWDSELSESEQEFDDNGEERAANRALQNFMQACSRTVSIESIFLLTRISQMIFAIGSHLSRLSKEGCIENQYDHPRK